MVISTWHDKISHLRENAIGFIHVSLSSSCSHSDDHLQEECSGSDCSQQNWQVVIVVTTTATTVSTIPTKASNSSKPSSKKNKQELESENMCTLWWCPQAVKPIDWINLLPMAKPCSTFALRVTKLSFWLATVKLHSSHGRVIKGNARGLIVMSSPAAKHHLFEEVPLLQQQKQQLCANSNRTDRYLRYDMPFSPRFLWSHEQHFVSAVGRQAWTSQDYWWMNEFWRIWNFLWVTFL